MKIGEFKLFLRFPAKSRLEKEKKLCHMAEQG